MKYSKIKIVDSYGNELDIEKPFDIKDNINEISELILNSDSNMPTPNNLQAVKTALSENGLSSETKALRNTAAGPDTIMQNRLFTSTNNNINSRYYDSKSNDDSSPITKESLTEIIRNAMSEIKVYVLESDITEAQNAIKSIVKQASF